jgi:DNA-binding XRE family transcriptional regulator
MLIMTGLQLKEIRLSLGLSQSDFAKKLGLSMRSIQNYEIKNNMPKYAQLLVEYVFQGKSGLPNVSIDQTNLIKDNLYLGKMNTLYQGRIIYLEEELERIKSMLTKQ